MKEKNPYKILAEAYERLDTELLKKAINSGADINFNSDETCFGIGYMLDSYCVEPEDPYNADTQKKWFTNKTKIIEMFDLAFMNGLNINECYDDEGGVYYPILSFLLYSPDDIEFVDYLIEHGFDPVSRIDCDSQFEELIDILEWDIQDKGVSIDHNKWLIKLSLYLMKKFPKLTEQYSYEQLLSIFNDFK